MNEQSLFFRCSFSFLCTIQYSRVSSNNWQQSPSSTWASLAAIFSSFEPSNVLTFIDHLKMIPFATNTKREWEQFSSRRFFSFCLLLLLLFLLLNMTDFLVSFVRPIFGICFFVYSISPFVSFLFSCLLLFFTFAASRCSLFFFSFVVGFVFFPLLQDNFSSRLVGWECIYMQPSRGERIHPTYNSFRLLSRHRTNCDRVAILLLHSSNNGQRKERHRHRRLCRHTPDSCIIDLFHLLLA